MRGEPVLDRVGAHACRDKLSPAEDIVLPLRKCRDHLVGLGAPQLWACYA
jgi:hypothetical protein